MLGDEREVGGVDEGDYEGDVGVAAVVFGVGEDGEFGGAEGGLWMVEGGWSACASWESRE